MKPAKSKPAKGTAAGHEPAFRKIIDLIAAARRRAFQAVNTELIDLYWRVGQYISHQLRTASWGEGVVNELARYLARQQPEMKGFTRANLFRMRQFYDTYHRQAKVAAVLRLLPWTHHLMIMARCKRPEERAFYLQTAIREHWSSRELQHQLSTALFERTIVRPAKVAAVLRQIHPAAEIIFKDTYLFDFLDLPEGHSESDFQKGLVANLRRFLLELGRDFSFVGEQYLLQVGGKDFRLDLLFYHRELRCLVAIELKTEEFRPEHLGKLQFYLEALDRNVKKPHERPSIGVLLCATKDSEVVEYALSRSASPALVAEYQTALPGRKLLQRKLHEFYQRALPPGEPEKSPAPRSRRKP